MRALRTALAQSLNQREQLLFGHTVGVHHQTDQRVPQQIHEALLIIAFHTHDDLRPCAASP